MTGKHLVENCLVINDPQKLDEILNSEPTTVNIPTCNKSAEKIEEFIKKQTRSK